MSFESFPGIKTMALGYLMDNGLMDDAPKQALALHVPGEAEPGVIQLASTSNEAGPATQASGSEIKTTAADAQDSGKQMTSFEAESRAGVTPGPAESQQTQAEREMRESARNIAGNPPPSSQDSRNGTHALGGTWRVESKNLPDWAATVGGAAAGTIVGSALAPKDPGGFDPVNNPVTRGKGLGFSTAAGIATGKIAEQWIKDNVRYPSISYTPDPPTPEQQARNLRTEEQRRHILEAMGRDGVYDPTHGPNSHGGPR